MLPALRSSTTMNCSFKSRQHGECREPGKSRCLLCTRNFLLVVYLEKNTSVFFQNCFSRKLPLGLISNINCPCKSLEHGEIEKHQGGRVLTYSSNFRFFAYIFHCCFSQTTAWIAVVQCFSSTRRLYYFQRTMKVPWRAFPAKFLDSNCEIEESFPCIHFQSYFSRILPA